MQQLENISRYKIEKVLGKGAVGTVYKAYDPVINQTVAIKVIHKQLLEQDDSGEQLKRFRNEVLAGRRLKHSNIVSIYEYGEEQDIAFIIMEFIEGRQLKDFLDEKFKFDLVTTHHIMQQLLAALDFAHGQGIVHRDIKPANIMVMQNWQIQVADFGIAKIESSSITQTGMIMGTPKYMSPEQCLGERIDHRADIFSTGVVFYHLLTGKVPFEAETMMGTLQQVLHVTPTNPSQLSQQVSPALDRIISKALAKHPDDRFQSAKAFSEALALAMAEAQSLSNTAEDDATVIMPSTSDTVQLTSVNEGIPVDKTVNTKTPRKVELANTSNKPQKNKWLALIGLGLMAFIGSGWYIVQRLNKKENLVNLLAKYPCASLVTETNNDGTLVVRGYLQALDIQRLNDDLAQAFGKGTIDSHGVKAWNGTFCDVVALLSPLNSANDKNDYGLKVRSGAEDNRYVMDDYLEMNVSAPNYTAYLYVDYFQLNGHVLHMYPTKLEQMIGSEPNTALSIGQAEQAKRWQISPPYGTEIVSVIASPAALFKQLRNEDELTETYLADLKAAVRPENEPTTAQYLTIETSPQ
ncbi:serine/threonine-protein kinase PksC [Methyloglobulus morosus KoM1]|uniref:non-specific serine/threonine protein kinase n=1 Tax=Methyloglobulus morosus KoM1 TaxID=1116472 RepID=V5BBM2_9GAMM|nr:serine/threonine-protein kinase [Methyloglobulus morosus]ESS70665.1 serine/threonine-protein kinase PksC [Methyloglobulus morosus KoM1]